MTFIFYTINFAEVLNTLENMIKLNVHTAQTMIETYAVDWSLYPDNAQLLEQEARSKKYWKDFRNPFASIDPIANTLPTIISDKEYEQAKSTLTLRVISINKKESLRGILVYNPQTTQSYITRYFIYDLNADGEYLRSSTPTNSEIFYLTNQ